MLRALVVAACATVAVMAQSRPQDLPAQPPVFRSGVEYVSLDVVFTDQKDRPVRNLTRDDFEIVEAWRRQTITDFQHVDVPVKRRPIDLKSPPAMADVSDNARPATNARAFVFVIDDGTILPADILPLKRAMTEFLATLTPDDVASVVYIKRSDLAQGFTKDLGSLIRGTQNINAAIGWAPDAAGTRNVIENVITTLAMAPYARKAIVYVGGGFQIDYTNTTPYTKGGIWLMSDVLFVFERARRANTPIYTLDPHGLGVADALGFDGHMEQQTPERAKQRRTTANKNADFMKIMALHGRISWPCQTGAADNHHH
jgi:VWFA-related protein